MTSLKLVLVTGRSIRQGMFVEDKFSREYAESVAIVKLDRKDMERLNIKEGDRVRVKSKFGEVIVKAVESKTSCEGVAFIPMGPWANMLTDPDTKGSGMPTLKGIEVEVSPTTKEVSPIEVLIEKTYGKKVLREAKSIPLNPGGNGTKTIKYVTCGFCGCLCDDLEVTVSGNKIVSVRNACALGRSKILNYHENRVLSPYIREGGTLREVSLEEAIKRASEILVEAKYPLLFGWSCTSVEAIKRGLELAELVGGVIDNTSVICHGPSIQALQEVGMVTSTLGKVKNYADLIIYWGCNPSNAHPRHMTRYSALSRGVYRKSRKERKVIVVDVRYTDTARLADLFIRVKPGHDYELVSALRMVVRGYDVEFKEVGEVPVEQIYKLADMMMSCKFGVIFYGLGITMTAGKSRNIEEMSRLVQDLNEWTKFILIPMRGHYNVTGTNQAFAWITGYPYSIDFSRGYPRYNPGVTSATDLLFNGDVDAALIVASDPVAHFPRDYVKHLLEIPLITIDPKWSITASVSDVIIPSAIVGVECGGTAYRMDKVPLRMKRVVESPCPMARIQSQEHVMRRVVDPPEGILPDYKILDLIISEVKKLKGFG